MTTTISWTDETLNPTVGCTRVSAGCDNCYAMGVAHRGMSPQHRGLTKLRPKSATRPGVDWNGQIALVPAMLHKPLRWRKPRRVFVNSMSDLFHTGVPFDFVAAMLGVMAATPHLTYQVLTKRPERAAEFFDWHAAKVAAGQSDFDVILAAAAGHVGGEKWEATLADIGLDASYHECEPWPLPNLHLGVSVEDQATADERIPWLMRCPARVRWVSYEPALGPVDFGRWVHRPTDVDPYPLDWTVIGGESGARARPFDLAWVRSTIATFADARCPLFVKQLGARPISSDPRDAARCVDGRLLLGDPAGEEPSEWPLDLVVRQFPGHYDADGFDAERDGDF